MAIDSEIVTAVEALKRAICLTRPTEECLHRALDKAIVELANNAVHDWNGIELTVESSRRDQQTKKFCDYMYVATIDSCTCDAWRRRQSIIRTALATGVPITDKLSWCWHRALVLLLSAHTLLLSPSAFLYRIRASVDSNITNWPPEDHVFEEASRAQQLAQQEYIHGQAVFESELDYLN